MRQKYYTHHSLQFHNRAVQVFSGPFTTDAILQFASEIYPTLVSVVTKPADIESALSSELGSPVLFFIMQDARLPLKFKVLAHDYGHVAQFIRVPPGSAAATLLKKKFNAPPKSSIVFDSSRYFTLAFLVNAFN